MSILQHLLGLREAESTKSEKIEAYGVKGMKSTKWRKTFKNQAEFEKWLDKQDGDVEVQGQRPLDESTIVEGFNDVHDLVDAFFDHVGSHSMEGRRGLTNFAKLCRALGYKDPNYYGQLDADASLGDIINFLEDNGGALQAMVEFIQSHNNSEWQDSLTDWLHEQGAEFGGEDHDEDEDDVRESVQLDEKVFDEDKYTWYVWTQSKPSQPFERRGGSKQLTKGMQFGLRPATSKAGTWRLIMKQKGPSIIFSIDDDTAKSVAKAALELI